VSLAGDKKNVGKIRLTPLPPSERARGSELPLYKQMQLLLGHSFGICQKIL
jgi:hypothetical protein